MQLSLRKDMIFFAGCAYLVYGTDHLFIGRTLSKMHSFGLYHRGPNMCGVVDNVKM